MTEPAVRRPLHEDPAVHARRWFLLAVMCLSLVMVIMSVSGLNTALPSIQRELGATASELQWIVDSYALVFAGLLLMAGALGDRFGRKRALVGGLAVFALGSLYAALSDSPAHVIAGRAFTGIGAAFVMPATLSIITSIFPPDERRKAIALWAGFAGAGGALGPVVSGALLEKFWWGSALLVNVPIVAFVIVAVVVFAPSSREDHAPSLDPVGAVLSLVGLVALVFAIIEGPSKGWTSAEVLGGFALAAVTLVAFYAWERRVAEPMLPMHLFRIREFSAGSAVITLSFFAMFGFFFVLTQYLQLVRGYSPLESGLSGLPMAVTLVIVAPRSAALADRHGLGPVVAAGFALVALGFSMVSQFDPGTAYVVIAVALSLLGAGMGMAVAPATGAIMSSVPMAKAGVGSAVNDTTREVGGALGIAVLGSVVTAAYRSRLDVSDLGLPPDVAALAENSVGAAVQVGKQIPGGDVLASRAGVAFTEALNISAGVSVAVAVVAGVVAYRLFGRTPPPHGGAGGDELAAPADDLVEATGFAP